MSCQAAFSQGADHVDGGTYTKRADYNVLSWIVHIDENGIEKPVYNQIDKTPLEKIFFGQTNSPVEYVVETSFDGSAGLRLYKDVADSDDWTLEVIPFGDYEMAVRDVKREIEKIEIPLWFLGRLPQNYQEQVKEHNEKVPYAAANEDTYKSHRPATTVITLHHLGDRLYEKMVALTGGFKAEGRSAMIFDGYEATFRCVVGDEVWTLTIHVPQKRALQMSNLCRQIIEDVTRGDEFDEWKYIRMLEPIEF